MTSGQGWAKLYAFEVDRAADAPVFRQIYLQLRSAILSGTLRPETKLPSTRELAVQLGVSRSAVVSAFEQLLAEGYTFGKKGAGTYIASDSPTICSDSWPQEAASISRPNGGPPERAWWFLRCDVAERRAPVQFGANARGCTHRRVVAKTQRTQPAFLRTATPWLHRSARHAGTAKSVCDYLQAARAVRCEPEQVVITAGTQQALDIVIRVMLGPDREVWIEDPGYALTRLVRLRQA